MGLWLGRVILVCWTPQPPAPGPGVNSARYPPTRWHSLVGPAMLMSLYISGGHSGGHSIRLPLLDEKCGLPGPFIFCSSQSQARVSNQGSLPQAPFTQPTTRLTTHACPWASARGEGLPHGDSHSSDVAAAGELARKLMHSGAYHLSGHFPAGGPGSQEIMLRRLRPATPKPLHLGIPGPGGSRCSSYASAPRALEAEVTDLGVVPG